MDEKTYEDEIQRLTEELEQVRKASKPQKVSRFKTIILVIVILAIIAASAFTAFRFGVFSASDERTMEVDTIREELVSVAKLTVYEYNFTQILNLNDSNQFFGIDVPFTDKRYIATIEGSASIGINVELVDCELILGDGGGVAGVNVTLPHSDILNITIYHGTLMKLEERSWVFNPVTTDDYNELLVLTEQEQEQKIRESDLLIRSDERIEQLISEYLHGIYGEELEVTFTYLEGGQATS